MKSLFIAGALLLLSGCSQFTHQRQVQTLHYQCGTLPLTVTITEQQQAEFLLDGERHLLPQTPAASGTRYSDDKYTFWSKGDNAFVQRGDRIIISDCALR